MPFDLRRLSTWAARDRHLHLVAIAVAGAFVGEFKRDYLAILADNRRARAARPPFSGAVSETSGGAAGS